MSFSRALRTPSSTIFAVAGSFESAADSWAGRKV
jgi:hypothetical protein